GVSPRRASLDVCLPSREPWADPQGGLRLVSFLFTRKPPVLSDRAAFFVRRVDYGGSGDRGRLRVWRRGAAAPAVAPSTGEAEGGGFGDVCRQVGCCCVSRAGEAVGDAVRELWRWERSRAVRCRLSGAGERQGDGDGPAPAGSGLQAD